MSISLFHFSFSIGFLGLGRFLLGEAVRWRRRGWCPGWSASRCGHWGEGVGGRR